MESAERHSGLDDFLAALRFGGIPIGPQELVWLQHVFNLEPSLDRQAFKDLLTCTLIEHEAHREVFESLFADWCPPAESDIVKPSQNVSESDTQASLQKEFEHPQDGATASQQERAPGQSTTSGPSTQ